MSIRDGKFEVDAQVVSGPDLGIVQFVFEGKPVGDPIDLSAPKWEPKEVSLGTLALRAGVNSLVVRSTGKSAESKGLGVGIDAFILKPRQQ